MSFALVSPERQHVSRKTDQITPDGAKRRVLFNVTQKDMELKPQWKNTCFTVIA